MTRELPVVIGWSEYVDLPEWGIAGLRAKVDTGARTSALHVEDVEERPGDRVCFDVVLNRKSRRRRVRVTAQIRRRGRVRSSSGHLASRLFVATTLRLGPIEKEIEIGLVDREKMVHRMLLGRAALTGPILIDVDRRAPVGERRSKQKRRRQRAEPP